MDNNVMFKISYGLYVLTAKDGEKSNGCIINTLQQVTVSPNRISIAVNKTNLTHDMIMDSRKFNISILSEKATFDIFKHFGFQSGRDTDKFADYPAETAANGIPYIIEGANSYLSGNVISTVDLGTHTMFIADVEDGKSLSEDNISTSKKFLSSRQKKDGYVRSVAMYIKVKSFQPISYAHCVSMARLTLKK